MALLVFFSIYSSKPFLSLSYSFSKVNKLKRKRKFFLETAIFPFLIGGLVVLLFTFPLNVYINIIYLFAIAVSLVISIIVINLQELKIDEVLRYKSLQEINVPLVVFLSLLVVLFTATWKGLYLGF